MNNRISIGVTRAEALVLDSVLSRVIDGSVIDISERRVLNSVMARLQRDLPEVFSARYDALLVETKMRIAASSGRDPESQ